MAKKKPKDREEKKSAKTAKPEKAAGGQHHAAQAHGQAPHVDTSLPATRAELLALHAAARQRRNSAPLDSAAFRAAVADLERIEVRVAAIEQPQDPPRG